MTAEPLRVLIVDDHPVYLKGLKDILETSDEGIVVVAAVGTGAEAVEIAARDQPDVVLMDLHLPGLSGIDATREIVGTSPHIGVVVITMLTDDASYYAAMEAGARCYLRKEAYPEEIVRAVTAAARGEALFGPSVAKRMSDFFSARRAESPPTLPGSAATTPAFSELTPREREILDLIAAGKDNAAISELLVLSSKTVRNHISNIFTKLQFVNRYEMIVAARRAGLGSP